MRNDRFRRVHFRRVHWLVCVLLIAGLASAGRSQRLHDQGREDQAQAAHEQAEAVKSSALFETLLKNLRILEAQDQALVVSDSRRNTRQAINSFSTWGNVFANVDLALMSLDNADQQAQAENSQLDRAKQDLEEEITRARAALAALRQKGNNEDDDSLAAQFSSLSDLDPVIQLVNELNTKFAFLDPAQLGEIAKAKELVAELTNLFRTVEGRISQIRTLKEQLGDFRVGLQKLALQNLELEAEHLKILAAIELRRGIELGDARLLVKQFNGERLSNGELLPGKRQRLAEYYSKCFSQADAPAKNERVTHSFARALSMGGTCSVREPTGEDKDLDRRDLSDEFMQTLFLATAIVSRVPLANRLAVLRSAEEEHRYSLKRRAVQASLYEFALTAGAQRLSLYYKGGIKPAQIAQLIFNLATPVALFRR